MLSSLRKLAVIVGLILLAAFVYYVYQVYRERTIPEQLAEIIHIEDSRELKERLKFFLESDVIEVRERAALAIGRIGAPGSAEMLFPVLSDPSIDVASTAAFAIGLTGEKRYASMLLDYANEFPSVVTAAAVEAAGRLGDSSMVELHDQLIDEYLPHPSPTVREQVYFALFRSGAREAAKTVVGTLEKEKDPAVRLGGLFMLARLGLKEGENLFIEFLADSDPFARSLAIRGLSRTDSPKRIHYLAIALNDDDENVVAQAISGLGHIGTPEAAEKITSKLEREDDEKLIIASINALQSCSSPDALPAVDRLMNAEPSDNIIAASLTYMAAMLQDRAVDIIDSILNEKPQPRLLAACADALGLIKQKGIDKRLSGLLANEDPMVRAAAFTAMCVNDSDDIKYQLGKALVDDGFVLVSLAVGQIEQRKLSAYLPTLQLMMSRGSKTHVDIRRSILGVADTFLASNPQDSLARKLLIAGLLDREYVVRKDAAAIYFERLNEDRRRRVPPAKTRIREGKIESSLIRFGKNPYAIVKTSKGTFEFELFFDKAPLTVLNFIDLGESEFYDGLSFHRVVPSFVIQGGDPRGDGWGGPDYMIRCEYSNETYIRGTVGIATSGKDTGGSQFFVTLSPQPHLDGRYTVFGQVLDGMDVVDRIVVGDIIESIEFKEWQE